MDWLAGIADEEGAMTGAELVAALKDVATRIRKRTTSLTLKAMADEIPPLADQIPSLKPPIIERRSG